MATRTVTRRSSSGAGVGDDAGGTITYELDEKTGIIRGSDGTEQMWVLVPHAQEKDWVPVCGVWSDHGEPK